MLQEAPAPPERDKRVQTVLPDTSNQRVVSTSDSASANLDLGPTGISHELGLKKVTWPVASGIWEQIYHSADHPLPTHSAQWNAAINRSGAYADKSCLYEFADGTRAILPLYAKWNALARFAPLSSPPPAWGFGGLLSDVPLSAAHIRAVMLDLASRPAISVLIRPNPLQAADWAAAAPPSWSKTERLAHVLDMAPSYDETFSNLFKSDTRNRIRRAERMGLEVETGNSAALITEYFSLVQLSVDRWARHQREPLALARWRAARRDPIDKFSALAAAIGPMFRLSLARFEGRAVAGILVLRDREAHYTRGAMDEEMAGKTFANYLLHAKAIDEACAAGCRHYHMGETGGSESLAQFKTRFGAVAQPYAEYRYERLPIAAADKKLRSIVKRLIGFRDA